MSEQLAQLKKKGGGSSGSHIKDAYRDKVFNSSGVTVCSVTEFDARVAISEGQLIIDTTNRTAWIYVDFTTLKSLGNSDYYGCMDIGSPFGSSYAPTTTNPSTRVAEVLCTDPSSTAPSKAFFINANNRIYIRKGAAFSANEHFTIYGSWQY